MVFNANGDWTWDRGRGTPSNEHRERERSRDLLVPSYVVSYDVYRRRRKVLINRTMLTSLLWCISSTSDTVIGYTTVRVVHVQSLLVPLTISGTKFCIRLHVQCVMNSLYNGTDSARVVPSDIQVTSEVHVTPQTHPNVCLTLWRYPLRGGTCHLFTMVVRHQFWRVITRSKVLSRLSSYTIWSKVMMMCLFYRVMSYDIFDMIKGVMSSHKFVFLF